ncbi:MAG: undecaprenyldiphospho-muramoylpentapeptide beta-N-acetylglucosaminyltransferase [Spirochaetales bacterium]
MKTQGIKIVFTGGGTGGHVYPGLAVWEALSQQGNFQITWIGSKQSIEQALVKETNIPFIGIPAGKFRREFSLKNITDMFRVVGGILASLYHIRRLQPHILFSKGGFVSVPPVIAAALLGVPIVSHESDFDPGLATRLALPFAKKMMVPFPESVDLYPVKHKNKILVTGNPVRQAILRGNPSVGRELLGFGTDKPILLVLGGSQGAWEINQLVWSSLEELLKDFFVVHQVGGAHIQSPQLQPLLTLPGYRARGYFKEELPHILAAASLVVSRAGAGTLWELAALKKPMLLIPLRGSGTRGDQVRNARLFAARGWASILEKTPITQGEFLSTLRELATEPKRREIESRLEKLDVAGVANRIAQELKTLGEEHLCNGMD